MLRSFSRMVLVKKTGLIGEFETHKTLERGLENFIQKIFSNKIKLDDIDYKFKNNDLVIKTSRSIIGCELNAHKEELKSELNLLGLKIQRIMIF